MEVTRIRALRGPNLWSHHTAIQSVVICTAEEDAVSSIPGFEAKLRARFPEVSPFQPVGHLESVSLARVLELVALGLQAQAGCPVTFSCTTPTVDKHVYQVVVEYSEEEVGHLAMEWAEKLCNSALHDTPFDLQAALEALRELDEDVRLGPSTGSIVDAAVARGIPYSRMTEGSMVRLGWGSKQRRIQAAEMDVTSAIAEAIAQDKELTKKLLSAAGVPVQVVNKVTEGRPHIVDMIKNNEIVMVINTVEERRNASADSRAIRTSSLLARVTTFTTIFGAEAAVEGMKYLDKLDVYSVQELHAQLAA